MFDPSSPDTADNTGFTYADYAGYDTGGAATTADATATPTPGSAASTGSSNFLSGIVTSLTPLLQTGIQGYSAIAAAQGSKQAQAAQAQSIAANAPVKTAVASNMPLIIGGIILAVVVAAFAFFRRK